MATGFQLLMWYVPHASNCRFILWFFTVATVRWTLKFIICYQVSVLCSELVCAVILIFIFFFTVQYIVKVALLNQMNRCLDVTFVKVLIHQDFQKFVWCLDTFWRSNFQKNMHLEELLYSLNKLIPSMRTQMPVSPIMLNSIWFWWLSLFDIKSCIGYSWFVVLVRFNFSLI